MQVGYLAGNLNCLDTGPVCIRFGTGFSLKLIFVCERQFVAVPRAEMLVQFLPVPAEEPAFSIYVQSRCTEIHG